MTPSLAARQVLSVSACCWSCRSKSGSRCWFCPRSDVVATMTATKRMNARAFMPPILHRRRGAGGACVGARQPVAQMLCSLQRGTAVEGHQRGRHAWNAHDIGTPPVVGDGRHLDQVRSSGNGLFEAMEYGGHVVDVESLKNGKAELYAAARGKQAKRRTKARAHGGVAPFPSARVESIFSSAPHAQDMHGPSTGFPQPIGNLLA